jgi:energy-coupling factor transporter ATP-binding protein EcfA2
MIRVNKFTYWYPGESEPALSRIDLTIPTGEFLGVVGANGAGKSTLCYALSGFVPHFFRGDQEGEVNLDGRSIAEASLGDLAGQVGLVFQNPFNQISGARFTVREEIAFGLENLGLPRAEMEARIQEAMDLVNIAELAERSPFSLSGGQQQRVAIASILAMQPAVLVLDEPTSQLDPGGTQDVFAALRSLVRQRRITVVLAEHKLELLAEFCDRVVALGDGAIRAVGEPGEVLAAERMLRLGVGRTQYTEAAAKAGRKKKGLPVTLKEARSFFK